MTEYRIRYQEMLDRHHNHTIVSLELEQEGDPGLLHRTTSRVRIPFLPSLRAYLSHLSFVLDRKGGRDQPATP